MPYLISRTRILFVDNSVIQFSQFSLVPTFSCSHQITSDALQTVNVLACTSWAGFQIFACILVTTVHATIAIVIYRTITNIVLVHQVYDVHDRFGIVCCVAVDFYVEDVTAACQVVIGCFDLCLVARRAFIVDGQWCFGWVIIFIYC